ncbi:MAG TPA: hypothetical protein VF755_03455 [Catenuloplanes sp.]
MSLPTTPSDTARPPTSAGRRRRTHDWVLDPLIRAATGFPLAVAAVPLALIGRPMPVAGVQSRLAHRRAGRRPGRRRVLCHSLLVAVPSLVALALAALVLVTAVTGYLYPLRPDVWPTVGHPFTGDHRLDGAWGGPTMIGAWLIHASAAFGLQAAALVLIRALVRGQDRITGRLL